MLHIDCELCGSDDFLRLDDGYFQCQVCGCKYSVEQARNLLKPTRTQDSAQDNKSAFKDEVRSVIGKHYQIEIPTLLSGPFHRPPQIFDRIKIGLLQNARDCTDEQCRYFVWKGLLKCGKEIFKVDTKRKLVGYTKRWELTTEGERIIDEVCSLCENNDIIINNIYVEGCSCHSMVPGKETYYSKFPVSSGSISGSAPEFYLVIEAGIWV